MTLVAVLAKGALVLLASWGAAAGLRRRGAAARHLAWGAGVAGAVALPALALLLPSLPVSVPAPVATVERRAEPDAAPPPATVWEDREAPRPAASPVPARPRPVPWTLLYGAGVVFVLGGSLLARIRLRRLVADTREVAPSDPRRRVFDALVEERRDRSPTSGGSDRCLLESDSCPTPLALGWRRGRVVLPAASRAWPERRVRAVLLHEIEHLDRGDAAWRLLAEVACALHWIDPLAWIAARRLRSESERACDDAVLRSGYAPSRYASDLLALSVERRWGWSTAGAFAVRGALEGRVEGILAAGSRKPAGRGARAIARVAVVALLPPLAAAVPGPADPAAPPASDVEHRPSSDALPVQTRWSGRGAIGGLALEGSLDLDDPASGEGAAFLLLAFRGNDGTLRTLRSVRGPRGAWTAATVGGRPSAAGAGTEGLDEALDAAGRKLAGLGAGVRWRGARLGRAGADRRAPGLAGSVMTGLPATTEEPDRGTLLAGWRHGGGRAGLFLCGTPGVDPWATVRRLRVGEAPPDALPEGDCLVAWRWDSATGSLGVLEVGGRSGRFTTDGAGRPADSGWLPALLATLQDSP